MSQLRERILAEEENVELALANLSQAMARTDRTVVELTAAASFVSSVYNGIENILKQILADRSIDIPKSGAWHQELLKRSVAEKSSRPRWLKNSRSIWASVTSSSMATGSW